MFRLRIALGVASSLVAFAALTIVFSGTGEAQGAVKPAAVFVTNTPLPVTGSLTATVSGDVSATIINPANNPVLVRDVDGQGAKELWQANKSAAISDFNVSVYFDPVPAEKALIIEHVNIRYFPAVAGEEPDLMLFAPPFVGGPPPFDAQFLVATKTGTSFTVDAGRKFYVRPGGALQLTAQRDSDIGQAVVRITATGYLVNYP